MRETFDFLYGLEKFGIKLGLGTISELMDKLEHPEKKFSSIHIAGTNGKGSVAAMCASVLREAGYKVGLYTSPHLVRFNERIQVNGEISDRELAELTETIRAKMGAVQPTFFEFTTALAFLYFAQKVDIAVVEVGMGGRLDATNVITPLVSVITTIGMDHMQYLGGTVAEIAREKAGIIKENVPVVIGFLPREAEEAVDARCNEKNATLFTATKAEILTSDINGQQFLFDGKKYEITLLGKHQVDNACVALQALSVVRERFPFSDKQLKDGLRNARWPGRLDVVLKKPLIIVDGAHNVDGMNMLAAFVESIPRRKMLVLGMADDKEAEKMVKRIVPLFEQVIVTQGNFKPMDAEKLAGIARKYCAAVKVICDSKNALIEAKKNLKDDELCLVTGSLYLIGDAIGRQ